MIAGALYRLFAEDSGALAVSIRSRLADYKSVKAIFTAELPEDAPFPAILISVVSSPAWGTRGQAGAIFSLDVQVFGSKTRSRKDQWALAEDCWKLVNRNSLATYLSEAGWQNFGLQAEAPLNTQEGLGFPGYTIRGRLHALKT